MISLDALVAEPTRIPDLTPAQRNEVASVAAGLVILVASVPLPEPVERDTKLTVHEAAAFLEWPLDRFKHTPWPKSVHLGRNEYSKLGLRAWDRNRRMKGARG